MTWTDRKFEQACSFSSGLHGNKHVFPVALWIAERNCESCKTTEIAVGLGGRLAANLVLKALDRLCLIGALQELPHPGRPHPRIFERLPSPYWSLVLEAGAQLDRRPPAATPRPRRR
jgi:hypothetical protein